MTADGVLRVYQLDIYHSNLKFLEKNDTWGVKNDCYRKFHSFRQPYFDFTLCQKSGVFA